MEWRELFWKVLHIAQSLLCNKTLITLVNTVDTRASFDPQHTQLKYTEWVQPNEALSAEKKHTRIIISYNL